jgi:hypothetical protein
MGCDRGKHKRMNLLRIAECRFPGGCVNRVDKLMVERIKAGEILIEESVLLRESCRFKSESSSTRRRLAWEFNVCEGAQRIREAGWNHVCAAVRPLTLCLLFLCLIAAVAGAPAQTPNIVPTMETIIDRMAQARSINQTRFRPYTVTRDYKLFGKEKQKVKAQVIADVFFVPPDSKNYSIQETNGTGLGERIVRRMLANEVEIAKTYSATDFSSDNYDFRFIRKEDLNSQHCYVLEMIPKRNEKNLLRGNLWVDASTYLLRRAEGEPARNPSWWVRNVRVVLFYADVGGMWLQTTLEGTATVRILGPYTVVSSDVKYEISELVADASLSRNGFPRNTGIKPDPLQPQRTGLTERRIVSDGHGDKAGLGLVQEKNNLGWKPIQ